MSEYSPSPDQDPVFAQNFIDNIQAVTQYNARHTGLSGAVRGLFDVITSQTEDFETPLVTQDEEAEMEREVIQFLRSDGLAAMGISIFDSSALGSNKMSDKELHDATKQPATLILLVTDGEKFRETIDSLKPAYDQQVQVGNGVNMLLNQTVSLIKAGYEVTSDADEESQYALRQIVDNQLDMFIDLTPKLHERGYGDLLGYKKLSEYTARYATGQLGDYIGAESLGLLQPDFGPSGWQKDSSAEQLRGRWSKALGYLLQLRDRDEASAYFSELFIKLRGDFDTAQSWLEDEQADEHRSNYRQDYIDPLKKEMAELSHIWNEQFTLECAMYSSDR